MLEGSDLFKPRPGRDPQELDQFGLGNRLGTVTFQGGGLPHRRPQPPGRTPLDQDTPHAIDHKHAGVLNRAACRRPLGPGNLALSSNAASETERSQRALFTPRVAWCADRRAEFHHRFIRRRGRLRSPGDERGLLPAPRHRPRVVRGTVAGVKTRQHADDVPVNQRFRPVEHDRRDRARRIPPHARDRAKIVQPIRDHASEVRNNSLGGGAGASARR